MKQTMIPDHKMPPGEGDAVFAALLCALVPVDPPAPEALKARILLRVAREAAAERAILTVPASDHGWTELIPKVHAKRVFSDGTAESCWCAWNPAHGRRRMIILPSRNAWCCRVRCAMSAVRP